MRITTYHDEATGRTLTANLKNPYLKEGAIPCLLPNCPKRLSKEVKKRERAEERRLRKDQDRLAQTIVESVVSLEEYKNEISFSSFNEFCDCFDKHPPSNSKWTIVKSETDVLFIDLEREPRCYR